MLIAHLAVIVASLAAVQGTDTTFSVRADARIDVQNFAGEIVVRAWERNAVRIVATHSRRDYVDISGHESSIHIKSESHRGPSFSVDYQISVPVGASLELSGTYTDIVVEGVRGPVTAGTVQGEVRLRGGDGVISLKSVEGPVTIENARGKVELNGVNRGLVLKNVNADIVAETVNGGIQLEGIQSSDVEATTVNGRITYDGSIRDRGRYTFGSHNGNIAVAVPENVNASVSVVSYGGRFLPRFTIPLEPSSERRTGTRRRHSFTLGNGSARLQIESFQGNVTLVRPGEATGRQER